MKKLLACLALLLAAAVTHVQPAYAAAAVRVTVLNTTNAAEQTFTVPSDFNVNGSVAICIGPGGNGATGQLADGSAGGGGGGGGAFGMMFNPALTPGSSTSAYKVTAGGSETAVYLKNAAGAITLQCDAGRNGTTSGSGANNWGISGAGGNLANSVVAGQTVATGTEANNAFTTILSSSVVQVAHNNHGLRVGETVAWTGASATGGVTINGTWQVYRIIDANTYQFKAGSLATSAATGGGAAANYTYTQSTYFAGGGYGGCAGSVIASCNTGATFNEGEGLGGGGAGGPGGAGRVGGGSTIAGLLVSPGGGGAAGHNSTYGGNQNNCSGASSCGDGGAGPNGSGNGASSAPGASPAAGGTGTANSGAGGGGGAPMNNVCNTNCANNTASNGGDGAKWPIWTDAGATTYGPNGGGGGGGR